MYICLVYMDNSNEIIKKKCPVDEYTYTHLTIYIYFLGINQIKTKRWRDTEGKSVPAWQGEYINPGYKINGTH